MRNRIIIYGAGAIGRGFLAPLFSELGYSIDFVDSNEKIINCFQSRRSYNAAIIDNHKYKIINVSYNKAYLLGTEPKINNYDIAFCCVGLRNYKKMSAVFKDAKTVICCENDITCAYTLSNLSKNQNVYFGIPDVITSSTSSDKLLEIDPLMTTSEKGKLYVLNGKYYLPDQIIQVNNIQLKMHWNCKFFIHNTPHAVLAYLGWLKGYSFIHEAMNDKDINKIVIGSIDEMTNAVVKAGYVHRDFANMYRNKELNRFSNTLLFDPIKRVAREPLRKLSKNNRLILGLRLAIFTGIKPHNTAIGVKAAFLYNSIDDEEAIFLQKNRNVNDDKSLLQKLSGIQLDDPLNTFIMEQNICKFTNRNSNV